MNIIPECEGEVSSQSVKDTFGKHMLQSNADSFLFVNVNVNVNVSDCALNSVQSESDGSLRWGFLVGFRIL